MTGLPGGAMFILSTSFLFWHKAGTGQIDMLLLGLEMCALYFLFKNDISPDLKYTLGGFSFMGLGILAKGPVGFIVPCGIYLCGNLLSGQGKTILKKTVGVGHSPGTDFPFDLAAAGKANRCSRCLFQ